MYSSILVSEMENAGEVEKEDNQERKAFFLNFQIIKHGLEYSYSEEFVTRSNMKAARDAFHSAFSKTVETGLLFRKDGLKNAYKNGRQEAERLQRCWKNKGITPKLLWELTGKMIGKYVAYQELAGFASPFELPPPPRVVIAREMIRGFMDQLVLHLCGEAGHGLYGFC